MLVQPAGEFSGDFEKAAGILIFPQCSQHRNRQIGWNQLLSLALSGNKAPTRNRIITEIVR